MTSRSTQIHYSTDHIFTSRSDNSDIILRTDGTKNLIFEGTATGDMTLESGKIWIGNAGNIAQKHFMSGKATLSNTGVLELQDTSVSPGSYTNTNLTVDSDGRITSASNGSGGAGTPAALTKTDDTNVILTLGGTPTTALLQATSLTLGWSGQLALSRGGTNASLTASNGGIFYSTATSASILSGISTANKVLLSGSSTAPTWSTATYPSSTSVNNILYSSGTNTISEIITVASGVLTTSAGGIPSISTNLLLATGSATSPTYSFSGGSGNNGMYNIPNFSFPGIGFAVNGVAALSIMLGGITSSKSFATINGSFTSPSYTFASSTNTGIYSSATHQLDIVNNGTRTLNITSSAINPFVPITGYIAGTPSALTKTDDTNVTLTLGGTPTTALIQATSLTLGWAGQLALSRGGTNASLTASNGGIFYSTGTAGAILAGTATANQVLVSGVSSAPSWASKLLLGNGSVTAPTYSFLSSTSTGFYSPSTNYLSLCTNGIDRIRLNNAAPSANIAAMAIGGSINLACNDANGTNLVSRALFPVTNAEYISDTTSGHYVMTFYNPNGLIGNILGSGSTTSFNTTSDIRLKEDIKELNSALDILYQIEIKDYKWKNSKQRSVGVLAQQLNKILPELCHVIDDKENIGKTKEKCLWSSVNYTGLIPYLVKGVQELQSRVENTEQRIKRLEEFCNSFVFQS